MKQRLGNRKYNSPQTRNQRCEEDLKDEDLEENEFKRVPSAFVTGRSRGRLARVDLSNTNAFFGRNARSNSPKEIDPSLLATKVHEKQKNKKSPPRTARENSNINKIQKGNKQLESKIRNTSNEHIQNLKRHNSPEPFEVNIEKAKDIERKKKILNEALWEAAEKGNLEQIRKLLESYIP